MKRFSPLAVIAALLALPILAALAQSPMFLNRVAVQTCAAHQWMSALLGNAQFTCAQPGFGDLSGTAATSQLPAGASVADPGTGKLEALLPVQTPAVTGNAYTFQASDIFKESRFSNGGVAFSVTLPPSTTLGLVNGASIVVNNVDAAATMTLIAGSGTTINGNASVPIGPGRSTKWVYDPSANNWRPTLNSLTAVLAANNLSELMSPAAARVNLGIDKTCLIGDANGTSALASTCRQVLLTAALTAPRTQTLPPASSVNAGQTLIVIDKPGGVSATNTLTFNANGSDTVNGGTGVQITSPRVVLMLVSDGVSQWTYNSQAAGGTVTSVGCGFGLAGGPITTSGTCSVSTTAPAVGFSTINTGLSASIASNALTINLTTAGGATPSAASPVLVPFQNNGQITWASITSALSVTAPSGSTFGVANATPFRLWIILYYNGGSPQLALFQSLTVASGKVTQIAPIVESAKGTTSAISGATSAGIPYSMSAISAASPIKVLGYVEYASGLTTGGSFASAPTNIVLFHGNMPLPGQPVGPRMQTALVAQTGFSSVTASPYLSQAITPTSPINIVRLVMFGYAATAGTGYFVALVPYRNSSAIGQTQYVGSGAGTVDGVYSFDMLDAPFASSSVTYSIDAWANVANQGGWVQDGTIHIEEIMD